MSDTNTAVITTTTKPVTPTKTLVTTAVRQHRKALQHKAMKGEKGFKFRVIKTETDKNYYIGVETGDKVVRLTSTGFPKMKQANAFVAERYGQKAVRFAA